MIKNGNISIINNIYNDAHYNANSQWILTGGGGNLDYSKRTSH